MLKKIVRLNTLILILSLACLGLSVYFLVWYFTTSSTMSMTNNMSFGTYELSDFNEHITDLEENYSVLETAFISDWELPNDANASTPEPHNVYDLLKGILDEGFGYHNVDENLIIVDDRYIFYLPTDSVMNLSYQFTSDHNTFTYNLVNLRDGYVKSFNDQPTFNETLMLASGVYMIYPEAGKHRNGNAFIRFRIQQ